MKRTLYALAVGSALALGATGVAAKPAANLQAASPQAGATAQEPTPAEMNELRTAARTEDPAAQVAALKQFAAAHPTSALLPVARQLLVGALVKAKAPTADLISAGDAAIAGIPEGEERVDVYNTLANELAERGEQLDRAYDYAQKAVASLPKEGAGEMAASVQDTLGWVQYKRGEYDKAAATLATAAAAAPEQQDILFHLGAAYEKAGKTDQAIDAYMRSAAVFLGQNSDRSTAALRALYQKRYGSLDGLDAKLAAARDASRKVVAFDSRRWDKPAPQWTLKDISGKEVKLSDYKGKLIVMDFWGSWCPPCRMELPKLQAMYDKYKDNKNVVFLTMNWERPAAPEERMKAVTTFMATNKYTFPVIIDHDRVAVESYQIEGFPTVYLIDGAGMIRYRNLGYEEGVDQILEAQLQSMMK